MKCPLCKKELTEIDPDNYRHPRDCSVDFCSMVLSDVVLSIEEIKVLQNLIDKSNVIRDAINKAVEEKHKTRGPIPFNPEQESTCDEWK